jgi:hypothetical protein
MLTCKDVPTLPVLKFLAQRPGVWHNWFSGHKLAVQNGMPAGIPDKLAHAKMNALIRNGLVKGCTCGCRGDYEITDKGLAFIAEQEKA